MEPAAAARRRSLAWTPHRVRWDRVGRTTLLLVLLGVIGLYIQPAQSLLSTLGRAHASNADVHRLEHQNAELRQAVKTWQDPRTLEREARRLGMVRVGERSYVLRGLR